VFGATRRFTARREAGCVAERSIAGLPVRTALRVRVYVGERDHYGRQPTFTAVVDAARKAGIAGASVFKGIEGYGAHAVVHVARVIDVAADLPILIELIDAPERIEAFLPALRGMVREGLVSVEEIAVVGGAAPSA